MKFVVLVSLFFFSGCAVVEPSFDPIEVEKIVTKTNEVNETVDQNISIMTIIKPLEEKILKNEKVEKLEKVEEGEEGEEGEVILNVFDDELYFEKDKVGEDKTEVVINYLDAYAWEKKVLKSAYKKTKRLWSKKQSKNFRKILEEDKYMSLCSDRRYWHNLEFEESEPERDILQSVLIIRYLNNLSHGCPKWIDSNKKIENENSKERINTKQIFSLLPHGVLIEKLLSLYLPSTKGFRLLLKKHKKSLNEDKTSEVLKAERLEIEGYTCETCEPDYKKKRKSKVWHLKKYIIEIRRLN